MEKERPDALEVAKKDYESAKKKAQNEQIKSSEEKEKILNIINSLEEKREGHWNICIESGKILCEYMHLFKPKRVLELGTSNAYSSLWISLGLSKDAELLSIECDTRRFEEAQKNLKRAGVEKQVQVLNLEISTFIENYKGEAFDCIFFDASQRHYLEYFKALEAKKMIQEGALLLADNATSHESTQAFVKELQSRFQSEIIPTSSGLLVSLFQ
jgi:predicted O-methyltransferase YrrM